MVKENGLRALEAELGDCIDVSEESLKKASYDGLKIAFSPSAVIRPRVDEQVSRVLKLANQFKVPVYTRGAASNLTGSAAPVQNGWVLDLSLLNKFTIDTDVGYVTAQPGVPLIELQNAVEAKNWYYPPDPSSKKWCTIGGNIACNAGGLRCVKYGVTRDYVVALKGYLPNGEPTSWARKTRKFSAGYNIRDLWIGSEGTLGVITEATLRLIPKPEKKNTILAAFESERKSLEASFEIVKNRIQPSIMEFLDRLTVEGAEKATGRPVFKGRPGRSVLLLEVDGSAIQVEEGTKNLLSVLKSLTDSISVAEGEDENLWEVRRTCSSAMFELGNRKLNEDVAVPLQELVPLYEKIEILREESGCNIAVFGHAGDGNLHVNIMYDRENPSECERAEWAVNQLMHTVVQLGGTISGEHGIGLAKSAFMPIQFSKAEISAMRSIKRALDPNNILNPGKIFDIFEPWNYSQVNVTQPWDHKKH